MAIYHLHVSHGSRSGGQSAAEKSDYIQREGKYAERPGLVMSESGHMPAWASSPTEFWKAADTYSRANARLFTEVEVGLPRELDRDTQIQLVRDIVRSLDAPQAEGHIPYTWALHDDGKGNPHAHIVMSSRIDSGHQRDAQTWFSRAANKGRPPESGGARSWSERTGKDWLESVRSTWAEHVNGRFADARLELRVDHRSYARQGIEQGPTMHEGWAPKRRAMMQRYNAQVREINAELAQAVQSLKQEQEQAQEAPKAPQKRQEPPLHELSRLELCSRISAIEGTLRRQASGWRGHGKEQASEQELNERLTALNDALKVASKREAEQFYATAPGLRRERSQQQARGDLPLPPGYGEAPSPARRDPGALPLPPGHPDRVEVQQQRPRSHSHKM